MRGELDGARARQLVRMVSSTVALKHISSLVHRCIASESLCITF